MMQWLSIRATSDVHRCNVAGSLHSEAAPQLADPQLETQLLPAAAPQPQAAPSLIRQLQAPLGAGLLAGLLGDPFTAVRIAQLSSMHIAWHCVMCGAACQ